MQKEKYHFNLILTIVGNTIWLLLCSCGIIILNFEYGTKAILFGCFLFLISIFIFLGINFMRIRLNDNAIEMLWFGKKINQIHYNQIYSIGSQTFFFFHKRNEIVWLHKNGRLILFFLLWLHRNKEFIQELITKVKENIPENEFFPDPIPKMEKRILWTRWGGDNTKFKQ